MKKHSILFTVNLTFGVFFLLITGSFLIMFNMYEKRENFLMHKRGMDVSRVFLHEYESYGITRQLQETLERFNFSIISDPNSIENLLNDKNLVMKHSETRRGLTIAFIQLRQQPFIAIFLRNQKIILKDEMPTASYTTNILLLYGVVLTLFLLLYFSIINKLKPLKQLGRIVENLGNEQFDFECVISGEDEVSKLTYEFSLSAQKLKKLKESRAVFIRNMMHELKTPITKGKFLVHLPQTEENQQMMQRVFYRLEALIGEFASVEELISTKKELAFKEYLLEDIVDNAIDILLCDESEVEKIYLPMKLRVDFDLFSIAVKNLLDNGIKYSDEKRVKVSSEGKNIIFENHGKELTCKLENYFEPFFRGEGAVSNQSFGLGLYIVKHILDAHGFRFLYEYKDGVNRFIIQAL